MYLSETQSVLQLREKLPALLRAVQHSGQVVTWICDPMHGNTESCSGYKTRRYDKIRSEVSFLNLNACNAHAID